jgi:putative flippase GtrA
MPFPLAHLLLVVVVVCAALPVSHALFARAVLARRADVSPQKTLVGLVLALNLPLWLAVVYAVRAASILDILGALVFAAAVFNAFGYAYFHFFNLSETGRRVRLLLQLNEAGAIDTATLEGQYSPEHMVQVRLQRLQQMGQLRTDAAGKFYIQGKLLLMAAWVLEYLGGLLASRDGRQATVTFTALVARFARSRHVSLQVIKHLMVGGAGVLINWIGFSVLRHSGLTTLTSTLIVHAVLLVCIFPLQKHFTFNQESRTRQQIVRFLVNDAGYITLDFLFAWLFIDVIGLLPVIGKACGLIILTPISFLSQRLWVFASKS